MASDVQQIWRLNLGSGPNPPDGWWNLDRHCGPNIWCADMAQPFEFGDYTFEGIVANHSLQCLTWDQILPCLRECRRVLKPGGVLRILVPDVLGAFHAYEERHDHWPGFDAISEDWDRHRKFAHYLTWGGGNRSTFTPDSLRDWLIDAEFDTSWATAFDKESTHGPEWMTYLDSRLGESIVVEAW